LFEKLGKTNPDTENMRFKLGVGQVYNRSSDVTIVVKAKEDKA
jgi:hypothetical protein